MILVEKIIVLSLLSYILNIPFGYFRAPLKKFSLLWFVCVHAAIPIIVAFRVFFNVSIKFAPIFIFFAILGQITGSKLYFLRNKNVKARKC
ncbi:MAG TPA: hypothetical protein EYP82_02470 [Hydrogenothermaceae bacterium]|nr:hypothetical protein [Hydrogenothermaceae bacterium]